MKSSNLVLAFLLVALLLALQPAAAAEPGYDVIVYSKDFQSGNLVYVNVTGPANMSIIIRIMDWNGIIVSGRDTTLDKTGNYSFGWVPSQEGDYNATVQFSTGLSITRKVTIQDKVDPGDIGELYQSIFRLQYRMEQALKALTDLVYVAILLSVISLLSSVAVFNHTRKRYSRVEGRFETFMKEDGENVLKQLMVKGQRKP